MRCTNLTHEGVVALRNAIIRRVVLPVLLTSFVSGCAVAPNRGGAAYKSSAGYRSTTLVSYAVSLQGTRYRNGGDTPAEGFDCSGFVQHVYQRHGIRLPRTTQLLANGLPSVTWEELQPGDLIFFNTRGRPYSHVGIYLDRDHFIHAPGGKHSRTVRISMLNNRYWLRHFSGARRAARQSVGSKSPV